MLGGQGERQPLLPAQSDAAHAVLMANRPSAPLPTLTLAHPVQHDKWSASSPTGSGGVWSCCAASISSASHMTVLSAATLPEWKGV